MSENKARIITCDEYGCESRAVVIKGEVPAGWREKWNGGYGGESSYEHTCPECFAKEATP